MKPVIATALLMIQLEALATITINIDAENLKTTSGAPMPASGLVILVASTSDAAFNPPTAEAFVSGDDVIVARWDLSTWARDGVLQNSTGPVTLSGDWDAGDLLQLYWFPTLALASTAPGYGTPYGQYRHSEGLDGGDPWATPADGTALWSLKFFTEDMLFLSTSDSNPAAAGLASLTTVRADTSVTVASSPNPSTFGSNVTLTATVTAVPSGLGTPTGEVIFRTNGVALSTNTLASGVATASTALLPVGTNTVTAEYAGNGNFLGRTNSLDGGFGGQWVQAATFTVSGSVELQAFAGSSRMVRFIASAVSGGTTYLQTNDVTLSFTGGAASYSLQVPPNTTHVSAKTAWNLRRRQAITFVNGAATVNFAGAANLKGGDIVTVIASTSIDDTDNAVTSSDYFLLLGYYLKSVTDSAIARADIDGDGGISSSDYFILLGNYLQQGDPQ